MANTNRDNFQNTFQNGYIPNQTDFANVFDSFLNFLKDGVTVTGNLTADKKIGIGNPTPTSRLGLAPLPGDSYKSVISLHPNTGDTNNSWSINLNPTATVGANALSIGLGGDANDSRLFIDGSVTGDAVGRVGIGTTTPQKRLHIQVSADNSTDGLYIQNERAVAGGPGWMIGHGDDASDLSRMGRLSFQEHTTGGSFVERLTILTSSNLAGALAGNVGIGVSSPVQKLEVSGAIKIGASSGTPAAGTIRYSNQTNPSKYELEVHNGTNWVPLIPTAGGGGTVTTVNSVLPVSGAITLTTNNIPEGTNKYFSNTLALNVPLSGFPGVALPLADGESLSSAILKLNANMLEKAYATEFDRVSGMVLFDRDSEYGSEASPVSDDTIFMADPNDLRHKRGATILMIHNNTTTMLSFGNGTVFKKLEGSLDYEINKNNYIFMNFRSPSLVTYTITRIAP